MSRVQPSSSEASRRMAKVRKKGTEAELALRRELFRRGLRYRVGFQVLKRPGRVADVAFPGFKIAVFVDGCFWHGCPEHATWPKQNADFWRHKIETNRARDAETDVKLRAIGWKVLRISEHEPPAAAAESVFRLVVESRAMRTKSLPDLVR